jgi:hypothetical protein
MPMRGTLAKRHHECTQQHHSSTTDAEKAHLNRALRLAALQNSFSIERSFDAGIGRASDISQGTYRGAGHDIGRLAQATCRKRSLMAEKAKNASEFIN